MGVTTDERPPLSYTKVIFGGCCNNADKMSKMRDGTKDIGLIIPIPFFFCCNCYVFYAIVWNVGPHYNDAWSNNTILTFQYSLRKIEYFFHGSTL